MIVVMCFNDNPLYIEQAEVAIKSIKFNSVDCEMNLYLVNFSENKFSEFRTNHVKLDDINNITGYSIIAMYDSLNTYKQSILWLDVDVLIRGELLSIFDDVTPNTLKILKRNDLNKRNVFNTGVVVVGYSNATMKMMKIASECILNLPSLWYADQICLYESYLACSDDINLVNLLYQPKWHDLGGRKNSFADSSIIWHCKKTHFNESPYKEEYEYYKNSI